MSVPEEMSMPHGVKMVFDKYRAVKIHIDQRSYAPIVQPFINFVKAKGGPAMDSVGGHCRTSANRNTTTSSDSLESVVNQCGLLDCIDEQVNRYSYLFKLGANPTQQRIWGNVSSENTQTLVHPHSMRDDRIVSIMYLQLPPDQSGELVAVNWTPTDFDVYRESIKEETKRYKSLLSGVANAHDYRLAQGNVVSARRIENYTDIYPFNIKEGDLIIHDARMPHGATKVTMAYEKVCLIVSYQL